MCGPLTLTVGVGVAVGGVPGVTVTEPLLPVAW